MRFLMKELNKHSSSSFIFRYGKKYFSSIWFFLSFVTHMENHIWNNSIWNSCHNGNKNAGRNTTFLKTYIHGFLWSIRNYGLCTLYITPTFAFYVHYHIQQRLRRHKKRNNIIKHSDMVHVNIALDKRNVCWWCV